MQGLYYLLFLVAIAIVIHWSWKNDKVPPGTDTGGVLRMTSAKEGAAAPASDPAARRRAGL